MSFGLLGMRFPSLAAMISGIKAEFSREALHQRFTAEAAEFMKQVFGFMLNLSSGIEHQLKSKVLKNFTAIYICDSSGWKLNNGLAEVFAGFSEKVKSACKLQTVYDYKTCNFKSFELQQGIEPDLNYHHQLQTLISKGCLLIVDLGYYSIEMFQKISEKGAFFISRLMIRSDLLYSPLGEAFKYNEWLKKQRKRNIETDVMLKDKAGYSVHCRLIAIKVDKTTAENRRENYRKKCQQKRNGGKPRQLNLDMCDWIVIVTNVPKTILPAQFIYPLYRLRWQIEIIFKQFKSILQLHKSDTANEHRLKCELWGRLIVALMVHHIHRIVNTELWNTEKRELSFDKLWKRFQERAFQMMELLAENTQKAITYLEGEIRRLWQSCKKLTQNSRLTSLQNLHKTRGNFNYVALT